MVDNALAHGEYGFTRYDNLGFRQKAIPTVCTELGKSMADILRTTEATREQDIILTKLA